MSCQKAGPETCCVLLRELQHRVEPQALLRTGAKEGPLQIVRCFAQRWHLEITPREVRDLLGAKTSASGRTEQWPVPVLVCLVEARRAAPALTPKFVLAMRDDGADAASAAVGSDPGRTVSLVAEDLARAGSRPALAARQTGPSHEGLESAAPVALACGEVQGEQDVVGVRTAGGASCCSRRASSRDCGPPARPPDPAAFSGRPAGANGRAADAPSAEVALVIEPQPEPFKGTIEGAVARSADEAAVNRLPGAVALRRVAPLRSGP